MAQKTTQNYLRHVKYVMSTIEKKVKDTKEVHLKMNGT